MTTVPITKNYTIYQGSIFQEFFTWYESDGVTPIDMTGYTAKMQVRKTVKSATTLLDLTTENGGINITDAANGVFNIYVSAVDTEDLVAGTGVYDLEINPGDVDNIFRLLSGIITISPEVTRD